MNEIIDNELTESKSKDLSIVLKWMLVGVLGCIIFQSFEICIQRIILFVVESQGVFSGNTSFLLSEVVVTILILAIFYTIVRVFKNRYDKINFRKLMLQLVISYFVINTFQFFIPFMEYLNSSNFVNRASAQDPLAEYNLFIRVFFLIQTWFKYGLVFLILWRK